MSSFLNSYIFGKKRTNQKIECQKISIFSLRYILGNNNYFEDIESQYINQLKKHQIMSKITIAFFCVYVHLALCSVPLDSTSSVYSIPYVRIFRPDLIDKYIGCGYNIAFSSYTYPDGLRDAAFIFANPYQFGNAFRCSPRDTYLKVFGYAQDYSKLTNGKQVAMNIQRSINGKFKNIIVDWKNSQLKKENIQLLQNILKQLEVLGLIPYLKVPASYLCKNFAGKPFILGRQTIKKIIVEMYGEDPVAYKNLNQIFTGESSEIEPSTQYPERNCPQFPTYKQLTSTFRGVQFFVQKTLQQQQFGFLGKDFIKILEGAKGLYDKVVFYDAFPPNIIRL